MSPSRRRPPIFALLLLCSACSFANDTLWPSLSGEDPRGPPPSTLAGSPATQSATGGVTSASTVPGGAPATVGAGGKAAELRAQ